MLALAATEERIALTPQQLDRDPWLLSCANGVIDLRTGQLREHDPADLISLGSDVPYDPSRGCPRWERFLDEVFAADADLVKFLHRAIGYALTGDTGEHTIFVCHGAGCNGKTTLLEITKRLLGDLAATAAFETFARTRDGRSPRARLGQDRARDEQAEGASE